MAGYSSTYTLTYETESQLFVFPAGESVVSGTLTVEQTAASLQGLGFVEAYDPTDAGGYALYGEPGTAGGLAQSFVEQGGHFTKAVLLLYELGDPTDGIRLKLVSALDGTVIEQVTRSSDVGGYPPNWIEFSFVSGTYPDGIPLDPDTRYFLQLERTGSRDISKFVIWIMHYAREGDGDDLYPPGGAWRRVDGVWVPNSVTPYVQDFNFRLVFDPGGPRGRGTVTASMPFTDQIAGASAGESSVSGALDAAVTYSSVGRPVVTATLTVEEIESLRGPSQGTSSVSGILMLLQSAVGRATVTGTLQEVWSVVTVGQGTVTAALFVSDLQGQPAGQSTVSGTLFGDVGNVIGGSDGASTVSGDPDFGAYLAGRGTVQAGASFESSYGFKGFFDGTDTDEGLAQRFQGLDGRVVSIELQVWKVGSPTDNVRVRIRPRLAQFPSVADSDWVSAASVSASSPGTYVAFPFSTPPTLSKDQIYFVELDRDGGRDEAHYYEWAAAVTV